LKALARKDQPRTRCCLCCKYTVDPPKKKSKKKKNNRTGKKSNKKASNDDSAKVDDVKGVALRQKELDDSGNSEIVEEEADKYRDDEDELEAESGVNKFLPDHLKLITSVEKQGHGEKKQEVISERSNEEDSSEDDRDLRKRTASPPRVLIRTRDDGDFFIDGHG